MSCVLLIWCWAMAASVAQAETVQSIEEFNGLKPKWSTLVGTTLQVEGRYSIFAPTQLRMEKCSLDFIMAREFPNPSGDSKIILLKGRLEKREAKLVFVVSDIVPQPSDVERFRSLKGKVSSNKPEEWYKLAHWGSHRAEYYRDDALKAEAQLAFKQGVLAEHRSLTAPTPTDLRALVLKLKTWDVDPALQMELTHEAFRLEYGVIRKEKRNEDGELLTELAKQLPGTQVPLTAEDAELQERYLASPLVAFKDGDEEMRKKFARVFYIDVLKHRILKEASPDGKNGIDIAARIEQQLPEYQTLAPEYRQKQLDYHLQQIGAMTRKEMTELVARLESINNPEYLSQLKLRWLTEKEKQIDKKNATALVDLADDYLLILGDRETAIGFYKKAYAQSPGTQAISDWLKEQGLVLNGSDWIAKGEAPPETDDPLQAAVRAGIVREGMSGEQVKSALGGEPTRRTRIATGDHLQEWWQFDDHGLSVELTRRKRPEPALVTKVITRTKASRPAKSVPAKIPVEGPEGF